VADTAWAMSEENVEVVRRAIEAYGQEGLDGVLRYCDPEIEWTSTGDYIERATYRGHDGLRRYLGTLEGEFEDLRIEPVEVIDAGEQVVSSVRFTGQRKATDAPVEMTLIWVGALRDGLIHRVRNYPDMAAALEAAGLLEQAAEGSHDVMRAMKPEAAWGAVQLGFAEILDLRTGIERRRHGAPPGSRQVSLAKHIVSPEGPGSIYLCQHAIRSKATLRRGAAEVAGGFAAWREAGLPVEEVA
jgi:ketosteroid isomerase-like protein/rhodanese-related sulfurtransferase